MKKIAIISSGFKPVPAVKGGAVEVLTTYLIDENEIQKKYYIDLYTIDDPMLDSYDYIFTKIKKIKKNRFMTFIFKLINCFITKIIRSRNNVSYYAFIVGNKLKKEMYDKIIVENNMIVYRFCYKYAKKNNIPIYLHLHNDVGDFEKNYYNSLIVSKTSAKVICVSKYIKKSFSSYTKSNVCEVLYNCVDISKFEEIRKAKNKDSILKKFKLSREDYIFTYTGRVTREKGVLELVNSFIKLKKNYNNIKLFIIGFNFDGKLSKYEKRIISIIKNNEDIYYEKYMNLDKIKNYLICSNVIVIPSIWNEPFGVVALEAMAMKKVIIATNSGGLVEPLNRDCAIIIEKNNIEKELYISMEYCLNNKEDVENKAENAYKTLLKTKEFDKNNYFNNFKNIIGE